MDSSIKTQDRIAPVKQFDCPSCGNALEVLHPRAQYVGCTYCGSYLDATSDAHAILKQLAKPNVHKPMSFIRLGQMVTLQGKYYQVIARTRWRMDYKEYWSEEGETGYSDERWVYDEWLLISRDRTYLYLVEDREGYAISEEIVPELPSLLTSNLRMRFFSNQNNSIVREYGKAAVMHFEGESNYNIQVGDQIKFASFKQGRNDFIAEWRLHKNGQVKEVEFFKETPIRRKTLVEAFDDNAEIGRMREIEGKWRFVNRMALLGAVVMLVMLLYSFASIGDAVFSQDYTISGTSLSQPTISFPISEPIPIEAGVPSRICLEAFNMPNGTEFFAFAYILDQDSMLINTVDSDFFFYTGYEDGEQWTESNESSDRLFKLPESGTYYIQAHVESEIANAGTLRVSVYQGVMLSRFYVFGLLGCIILAIFAWMNKSRAAIRA